MQTLIHACTLLCDSNVVLLSKLTLYIIDINKSDIIKNFSPFFYLPRVEVVSSSVHLTLPLKLTKLD